MKHYSQLAIITLFGFIDLAVILLSIADIFFNPYRSFAFVQLCISVSDCPKPPIDVLRILAKVLICVAMIWVFWRVAKKYKWAIPLNVLLWIISYFLAGAVADTNIGL